MRKYLFLFLYLMASSVFASFSIEVSDAELIKNTDHILIGKIVGVDMIDSTGRQIHNIKAKTGSGSQNVIRLIINVDEVLESNSSNVPAKLYVPLDKLMHYSYWEIKAHYPEVTDQRLILLSGPDFQSPVPGHFHRELLDKDYYLELFKTNKLLKQDK